MKELKKFKIDPELRDLLPPLTQEEKTQLEKSILENGYVGIPIFIWNEYIVDGHNRYDICWKHNIPFDYTVLGFDKKEEVIEWMLDIQLGRRNLTPIQRIAITEKYRPIYERQAKVNQSEFKGNQHTGALANLPKVQPINTRQKLAEVAGVGEKTYAMGSKILQSDNEDIKQKVLSGEMSINAGYNAIRPHANNDNYKQLDTIKQNQNLIQEKKEDNIKDIIADLKVPRNAEDYLNFKNEIECIQENFRDPIESAFDILFERHDINEKITLEERDIAIDCIQDVISKLAELVSKLKNIKIKGE